MEFKLIMHKMMIWRKTENNVYFLLVLTETDVQNRGHLFVIETRLVPQNTEIEVVA